MLPADPTDDDIEGMVVDALERLPAPFRDQLGSVAIVIEDEATPEQLASVGAHGLYGLYQGIPRTRWSADGAPAPSKITIFRRPLVRANRTPGTPGGGRRPTRSTTRSPTTSGSRTIGSTSSSGASPDRVAREARQRPMRDGDDGEDPLHPARVLRAARMEPIARDQRPVARPRRARGRRCPRTRSRARPRAAPSIALTATIPSCWRRRVAVVRAGRGDRVVRGRDGDDPVRRQAPR